MSKTWFITGASRGFGRAFTAAALQRGDHVVATARNLAALDDLAAEYEADLLPLRLDVTDRAGVTAAVRHAHAEFGRLDVVVNNAGYGHFGMVEELSEDDLRDQMETNLFGVVWVTQAAVPLMRAQGGGHIVQISSIGGVGAFTNLGAYHASKWALEGISESLALEVAAFGVKVTLVEPGGFATDWAGASARRSPALPEYDGVREAAAARRSVQPPGHPDAAARALLEVVDAAEPPLRVLFGAAAPGIVTAIHERRLADWKQWERLAYEAQG
ncbi:oxidoreductase [Nonomuraea sp. ATR24]|uniref:oxidoreductase n=1 Tax=Nonomuraea sp. ATR24 TaxID=1676744 RepID=UPI0035C1E077